MLSSSVARAWDLRSEKDLPAWVWIQSSFENTCHNFHKMNRCHYLLVPIVVPFPKTFFKMFSGKSDRFRLIAINISLIRLTSFCFFTLCFTSREDKLLWNRKNAKIWQLNYCCIIWRSSSIKRKMLDGEERKSPGRRRRIRYWLSMICHYFIHLTQHKSVKYTVLFYVGWCKNNIDNLCHGIKEWKVWKILIKSW